MGTDVLRAFFNPGGRTIRFTRGGSGVVSSAVSISISISDADEDVIEGIGAGGSPVVIGSIDTGVNLTHTEFLAGQRIARRDHQRLPGRGPVAGFLDTQRIEEGAAPARGAAPLCVPSPAGCGPPPPLSFCGR